MGETLPRLQALGWGQSRAVAAQGAGRRQPHSRWVWDQRDSGSAGLPHARLYTAHVF